MPSSTHGHPSDRVLIGAIDGELTTQETIALDAHLRKCEACRARVAAFADVEADIERVIRNQPESQSSQRVALRDRLRLQMATRAATWERSWWFRLRKAMGPLSLTLGVGASVAVLALVVYLAWPSVTTSTSPEAEVAALPIHAITPGTVGPVNLDALCAGHTVERPPISTAVREAVLREYRMERVASREYELDYLVTPELGGVPDARNLWPERYATRVWNAQVKDELEDLLPQLICRGQVDLATAQRDIAENWIAAYKKYFRTEHPVRTRYDTLNDDRGPQPARLSTDSSTAVQPFLIGWPVDLLPTRATALAE